MAIIGYKDLGDGTRAVKVSIEESAGFAEAIADALSGMEIDVSAVDIDALALAIDDALRAEDLKITLDGETIVLGAGTAIAGKVGIDQTTPGTTNAVQAANPLTPVAATIAESGSLSAEIDLGAGRCLCAIDMPADWTAANLTFQASYNTGGTFDNLYDQYGTEKTITAAEDRYITLDDPAFWLGVRYIKVRSGTAASAVNQAAARTIYLVTKPV